MNPITLAVAELKPALAGLGKVISKRTTLPVLGCVRIERTDGHIELAATDLDNTVITRLPTPAPGEPRTLLVPFEDLSNITKGCGREDTLQLSGFKDKIAIRFPVAGDEIEHQVESLPVTEFPPVPNITGEPVRLEEELRQAIRDALACASLDPTRLTLNGAFLDVSKPGAHYVVGTDGRHLFSSNSFSLPLKDSLIIPAHKFLGWKEFNHDGDWKLRVSRDTGQFEIASDYWRFIARPIEGNYPNWRQVVPAGGFNTTVEISPDLIDVVVQTIARMPCHDSINFGIGIEIADRHLRLLGKSEPESKWSRVEVGPVQVKGKDVTVFLNRQFFAKALRFGLSRIEVIDPLSPLRFSAGGRQMIVMPIRADGPSRPAPRPEPIAATNTPPSQGVETNERKPMPETNGKTAPNGAPRSTTAQPALDSAFTQIDEVKTGLREAIAGLNKLTDLLRQAYREHKTAGKEIDSVRQTLRSLQSVRI